MAINNKTVDLKGKIQEEQRIASGEKEYQSLLNEHKTLKDQNSKLIDQLKRLEHQIKVDKIAPAKSNLAQLIEENQTKIAEKSSLLKGINLEIEKLTNPVLNIELNLSKVPLDDTRRRDSRDMSKYDLQKEFFNNYVLSNIARHGEQRTIQRNLMEKILIVGKKLKNSRT